MRPRTYAAITGFILACVVLTTLVKTIDRAFFRSTATPTPSGISSPQLSSSPPAVVPVVSAASIRKQHRDALVAIKAAQSSSKETLASVETWKADIEPLLEHGSGSDMSEEQVGQLAFVINRQRTPPEKVRAMVEELSILQRQINELQSASTPEPIATAEVERIQQLSDTVAAAKRGWASSVTQAQAIVRQSVAESESEEATLRDSVNRAKDRETLAALERERESGPMKTEVRNEVEIETFDSNDERREAALATEVASVLAPFFEPRSIQPSLAGSFSIKFSTTFDSAPMSLGKIKSIGALDPSVVGLKKLALLGGNRKLPEPRWSIASQPGNWSGGDEDYLKKAQQYLIDYGDILVQEGKLSP